MDTDTGDADTGVTASGLLPEQEAASPSPAAQATATDTELAHAALVCGYTAQDASRQMDDSGLAQYFGISPRVIAARSDDFYRRWVIQTVRQILPSSPEDCRAILDNPQSAPAITQRLLASQQTDAPATAAPETPPVNKPRYAPETSQRIRDVGDQIAELQRRPQGAVSQQEIDNVLGRLHDLRKAPDLTNTEHNNLAGLGLTAFTIAASHGLKTAPETVNDPLFTDAAVGSMAFSDGGNSSLRAPGNPASSVLPRTGSSFVATDVSPAVPQKRVGRWMSQDELEKMQRTGKVQDNLDGQIRVSDPASPDAYRNAPKGDVYVEFDVPADRVKPHSQGTGRIPGQNSRDAKLAAKRGEDISKFEMPSANNIKVRQ